MELKHLIFGMCCCPRDADWFVEFVARFGNAPSWLIVANLSLSFFNRDLYFTVASNTILFVCVFFLDMLSRIFRVPHPEGFDYDFCDAFEFAFPDPIYVTTIAYVIIVTCGFWINKRLYAFVSRFMITGAVIVVFGYVASTLISRYFDVGLLIANSVIAIVIASLFISSYAVISRILPQFLSRKTRKSGAKLVNFLGRENETFASTDTDQT
jgi:hypothetical protein